MMFSACSEFPTDDGNASESKEGMRQFMGPRAVDQSVRHAISTCWMMLPDEKKTVDAVEAEIRRLVDRAIDNLREDAEAFGLPKEEG